MDICCNSRHYFNRKTPFLKHKNVNLKNLPEVKVVCTDFRRPKSINTTHLCQDIVTTNRHIVIEGPTSLADQTSEVSPLKKRG